MTGGAPLTLTDWCDGWTRLATYPGRDLLDADARIEAIVRLWHRPLLPGWWRGKDDRILDPHRRYTRGNGGPSGVRVGEHAIEYAILAPSPTDVPTTCLGAPLLDGVNAVPLTKDGGGRRRGNVEADMLLLSGEASAYRLVLVEVKADANNAWYAAVENLRQLRLMCDSAVTQRVFHRRRPDLALPDALPVSGTVVAPGAFYTAAGKRAASVAPARKLLRRMAGAAGVDATLSTWDPTTRTIATFAGA